MLLRVLSAAGACGVTRALLMPDRGGIRALLERHLKRGVDPAMPRVEFLPMDPISTVEDSFAATRLLLQAGVSAIVVLGGDGTHRAVVRELYGARAQLPIAGLSTGTNNAFPEMREPTITGMAVGLYASGAVSAADALTPHKLIVVTIADPHGNERRDIAIVDAVISHDRSVGARALWKTSSLAEVYLTFADPLAIGLSAIGGLLQPVGRDEAGGLAIRLAGDTRQALLSVHAPIAPGMVRPVAIASWQRMAAGDPMTVHTRAGTVALDGERELAFEAGEVVRMTLRNNAFLTVDTTRCMRHAALAGLLRSTPLPHH